jgi:hypothetical protein
LLFWGTITSAVGAFSSTDALAEVFPGLRASVDNNPTLKYWLDSFLALIYYLLLQLAYPVVRLSTILETFRIADSELDSAVLSRFLTFLVIQVFVFYSIAGSVFKSVVEIAFDPTKIVTTLSSTIHKNAAFFLSYIAVQTFQSGLDLTRVLGLLYHVLKLIYSSVYLIVCRRPRTSRPREQRYHAAGCCWDLRFPSDMGVPGTNAGAILVIFITMCYTVIQPLVNFAAVVFFGFARTCFALRILSNSVQQKDGGGAFWPRVYDGIVAGALTANATVIGTLLIKRAYGPAVFTFTGPFLATMTLGLLISRRCKERFKRLALVDVLDMASPRSGDDEAQEGESIAEPIMRYNHVLGRLFHERRDPLYSISEGNAVVSNRMAIDLETSAQTRPYAYAHPVLYERDCVAPFESLLRHSAFSSQRTPVGISKSKLPPPEA